jgi:hypothetical protein
MTAEQIADVVMTAVKVATAPLLERIQTLEGKALIVGPQGEQGIQGEKGADGAPGPAGKDADPELVLAMKAELADLRAEVLQTKSVDVSVSLKQMVDEAVAAIPTPRDGVDGHDAPPVDLDALVLKVAELVPVPKDGRDGKSVTVDDVAPLLSDLVTKAIAEIPPARNGVDGVGIAGALITSDGQLAMTLSDGKTLQLGSVVGPKGQDGRDGMPGVGRPGADGQNGLDGLGFDDIVVDYDGDREFTIKFLRGERVKAFTFTVPFDRYRGVYADGKTYNRGDGVTWAGSEWHCNETTRTKPGESSKAWTLKVKRGRDGKDGRDLAPRPMPVVTR